MKDTPFRGAAVSALGAVTAAALVLTLAPDAPAQPAPPAGIRENPARWHALVGATVIPAPGERIENATVVIRDGVIVSVRGGGAPPEGARVWDYTGMTIYPGLIEPHLPVSAPAPDEDDPGNHWNAKVTPQRAALDGAGPKKGDREKLVKMGFTAAAIAPDSGIFRGSAGVVLLNDPDETTAGHGLTVVRDGAYQEIALERGGFGRPASYPGSEMGAIALVRQTFLDTAWREGTLAAYKANPAGMEPPAPADALDALIPAASRWTYLFDAGDELEAVRAAKIAREFGLTAAILGSGTEFRRLDDVVSTGLPIILPLAFPKTPTVDTIADQNDVTLRDLMTWEQAPTNPRRLLAAGATVALTTDKLPKGQKFEDNLRSAIRHGLSEDDALAMLTTTPAAMLGVGDRLGRVAPGFIANLVVVADGGLFDKGSEIRDVWVEGDRHEINEAPGLDPSGQWAVAFTEGGETHTGTMTIKDKTKITFDFEDHQGVKARKADLNDNRLSFLLDGEDLDLSGVFAVTGVIRDGVITGVWKDPAGAVHTWRADLSSPTANGGDDSSKKKDDEEDEPADVPEALPTPFGAYGFLSL
ncbi:MAG: hypothetical protein D6693_10380, partial [Planctomycetota bacterium]